MTADDDGRRSRSALGGLAFWTLLDQAMSSLTNVVLSLLVARAVSADDFGAFGLAFIAFSFLWGLTRALVSDPLLVRYSARPAQERKAATARAAGAVLLVALAAALCCAVVGLALSRLSGAGSVTGVAFLVLAASLPGLLLQDFWRQASFAASRPAAAAANDFAWLVVQFSLVAWLLSSDRGSVALLMTAWGTGAAVAAVLGTWQLSVLPDVRTGAGWIRSQADLGLRMSADYVLKMGAIHLGVFVIGAVGGLAAAGAVRAAQVVLGPIQLLFSALPGFAVPLLARRALSGPAGLVRPGLVISAVSVAGAAGWVGVLLFLPDDIGVGLLGSTWEAAREVMGPYGLVMVLVAAITGAELVLRATARADQILRATYVQAALTLVLMPLGALLSGPVAAVMGLVVAHLGTLLLTWSSVLGNAAGASPSAERAVAPVPASVEGRAAPEHLS